MKSRTKGVLIAIIILLLLIIAAMLVFFFVFDADFNNLKNLNLGNLKIGNKNNIQLSGYSDDLGIVLTLNEEEQTVDFSGMRSSLEPNLKLTIPSNVDTVNLIGKSNSMLEVKTLYIEAEKRKSDLTINIKNLSIVAPEGQSALNLEKVDKSCNVKIVINGKVEFIGGDEKSGENCVPTAVTGNNITFEGPGIGGIWDTLKESGSIDNFDFDSASSLIIAAGKPKTINCRPGAGIKAQILNFNKVIAGVKGSKGLNGTDGQNGSYGGSPAGTGGSGTSGTAAGDGGTGIIDARISCDMTVLCILAGDGGKGGDGGDGGSGGKGKDGTSSFTRKGNPGGTGGTGGPGGNGGKGGEAGDSVENVSFELSNQSFLYMIFAKGGAGGSAGWGGSGGEGGDGGLPVMGDLKLGSRGDKGARGSSGLSGSRGSDGKDGTDGVYPTAEKYNTYEFYGTIIYTDDLKELLENN